MFYKFAFFGIALIALMVIAHDQQWAQRAGVTGHCVATQNPATEPNGSWYACKQGVLTGFPSLEGSGCNSAGIVMHQEVWECAAPLVSAPAY
jgi:hypothetical protein